MMDNEFVEIIRGVQDGKIDKDNCYRKIYRDCGKDLKAVLDRTSKKGILLTYGEMGEVMRAVEVEEREKKIAEGMSETENPEEEIEGTPESGEKAFKKKQKEAPRGQKSTKRRLVLKDEEDQPKAKKESKRTSQRLLGRGKPKKTVPVDAVEVSSEEEVIPPENEGVEEQPGLEDQQAVASNPINSEPKFSSTADQGEPTAEPVQRELEKEKLTTDGEGPAISIEDQQTTASVAAELEPSISMQIPTGSQGEQPPSPTPNKEQQEEEEEEEEERYKNERKMMMC